MKPKLFWQTVLSSFALTAVLATWQFFTYRSTEFMGQKTDSLAKGLLSFYPTAPIWPAVKLILIAWMVLTFVCACYVGIWHFWKKKSEFMRFGGLVFMTLAVVAFMWSGYIKYPAFFSQFFSAAWADRIFGLSFVVSPLALRAFAGLVVLVFAAPGLLAVLGSFWALPRLIVVPIAAIAIIMPLRSLFHTWPDADKNKPQVLIIGIDSMRVDRFHDPKVMPHMATLLQDKQTVSFADHYVGVPRTFPSWVEMLQGKYAPQTGIRHMFPGLEKRSDTFDGLVTTFRDAGYHTVAVSDFAGDIFPRFDAGFARIAAPNMQITTLIELGAYQTFPWFLTFALEKPFWHWFPALKESTTFSDPEQMTQLMRDELKYQHDKPTMMLAFYSTAHFPYASPFPYYNKFADGNYQGAFKFLKNPSLNVQDRQLPAADKKQINALYDGALSAVDDALGDLFADLKRKGLWDNTLIVITADHGEDLYDDERQLQGHGDQLLGEHVLRVPLVMKLPQSMQPTQKEIPFLSRSIDMASTVAHAAGINKDIGAGHNWLPWMLENKADPKLTAYSESEIWFASKGDTYYQKNRLPYPGISGLLDFDRGRSNEVVLKDEYENIVVTARHRSWIEGDYKLVYMPTKEGVDYSLYNRRKDPENLTDLSEDEPRKTDELASKLLKSVDHMERSYRVVDGYVLPRM